MIERFQRIENDWWRAAVTPESIDASRAATAAGDRVAGASRFDSDYRWCGRLGEYGLRSFLRGLDVAHRANGGVDDLPDVRIANVGVSVKATATKAERLRLEFWAPYPKAQLDAHGSDEIFFTCFRPEVPDLTLMGGIEASRFLAAAEVVVKGQQLESGSRARYDFYRVRFGTLEKPLSWVCRVAE